MGYQQKHSIDDFPKKSQPWIKWFVILLLIVFGGSLLIGILGSL
ncbi:hypothetical protein P4361_19750 [Fictibacillus sp. B-59209]|nr:hypothetical protein [Fictibacillus sp. B-59209]